MRTSTVSHDCVVCFGQAVEAIDSSEGALALTRALGKVVDFRFALSLIYGRDVTPSYVCDTFSDATAKRALHRYMSSTYLLNPVYAAFHAGLETGVYRIRDLAPDAYVAMERYHEYEIQVLHDEEIGYRTHDWPRGMEELVIAITLPNEELAEISLLNPVENGGFDDEDIARLQFLMPLIVPIVRRSWPLARRTGETAPAGGALDRLLKGFGEDLLTAREQEVMQLILKGHSSHSISCQLDISISTVKSHRRNLYSKFGISTQQELFSRFLSQM